MAYIVVTILILINALQNIFVLTCFHLLNLNSSLTLSYPVTQMTFAAFPQVSQKERVV